MSPYMSSGPASTFLDRLRPRDGTRPALALLPSSIESSGGVVTRWRDESGYHRHATPGGSPAKGALAGLSCVVFDGSNDVLDGSLTIPDQPYTIFMIRKSDDTATGVRRYLWDTTDTGAASRCGSVINAFGSCVVKQEIGGDDASAGALTTTSLEVVRVDFTTKHRVLFVNGVWKVANAVPTIARPLTAYRLGARIGGGLRWAGKLALVLVIRGDMTQKEKERIEGALMDMAGVARPFSWLDVPEVSGPDDPRIVLPDVIHCVTGRPVRIGKWSSICWTGRYPGQSATCDLPFDRAPQSYWQVTPPAAGDYSFTMTCGAYSKATTLRAVDMPPAIAAKRYILCVGDSRTNRGGAGWIQYLGDILGPSRAGFVGTTGPQSSFSYSYYAADGRAWSDFDDSSWSQFYNGGLLDIPHYIAQLTHAPDMILWGLGQNDVYNQNVYTIEAAITTCFGHIDHLLGAWTAALPDVKHFLAYNWPLALDPACFGGEASTRDAKHRMVHRYVERLAATYGGREAQKIYLMPRTYIGASTLKGSETDGIHENRSPGHDELAEAALASLVAFWNA